MGPRPGTKDLKDQSGTVNDLALKLLLEIALLHRRERGIDDNDIDFQPLDRSRQPFNGPATQIGRARRATHARSGHSESRAPSSRVGSNN